MQVFVTGATGFTGGFVASRLLEHDFTVRALVRPDSDRTGLPKGLDVTTGTLEDVDRLAESMRGAAVLVNVASIGFGHAQAVIEAAKRAGVKRAVFFSTTALFTKLNASSKSVRLAAEDRIRESGLEWTILRPTMIYGSARDRNIYRLIRYLAQYPVIPVIGDGRSLQQPVYVDDLAKAVVGLLQQSGTVGKAYNLPGAAPLSFVEIIDTISHQLGRKVRQAHFPARPIISVLRTLETLKIRLPLKAEQFERLNEDKAFDYTTAARDFGYQPKSFDEGVEREIEDLRQSGVLG
jgi:nucleoside-diphosphate-sugar epimerase